ncbi:MAG: hypothetical protein QNJ20_08415 [Paracoccaceae bacterium]|nr:hypothetical protein [Paracoccaceae bacterium]
MSDLFQQPQNLRDAVTALIVFAPFDRVMPATMGAMRAAHGYVAAEPWNLSQQDALKVLGARAGKTDRYHTQSAMISAPKTPSSVTVIEDWNGPDPDALASLLPDTLIFRVVSVREGARLTEDGYRLSRGAEVLREVRLDRGVTHSGWTWEEHGSVQPWEDRERLRRSAMPDRLDRALLFHYAEVLGIDLRAVIFDRLVSQSLFAHALPSADPEPPGTPTELGEDEFQAALASGFGHAPALSFDAQVAEARKAAASDDANAECHAALFNAGSLSELQSILNWPEANAELVGPHQAEALWRQAIWQALFRFGNDPDLPAFEDRAAYEMSKLGIDLDLEHMRRQVRRAAG